MAELPIQQRMWRMSLLLAALLLNILVGYTTVYNGSFSLLSLSQAIAGTAGFLIGISFALGSLAYFFKKISPWVAYRKYIGLTGFWIALLYSVLLPLVDPEFYLYNFFDNLWSADILFGLFAMAILLYMALISNTWGIKTLGPTLWKDSLRLGYLAYALLISRAMILEWDIWAEWLTMLQNVPPPRLPLSIFALGVILLRGTVAVIKKIPTTE